MRPEPPTPTLRLWELAMKAENFLPTPSDQPPMNAAIEDILARAGEDDGRVLALRMWLMFGTEYLCREVGRKQTREWLQSLDRHARDARPAQDWPS